MQPFPHHTTSHPSHFFLQMQPPYFLLIILLPILLTGAQRRSTALECVLPSNTRTRTFTSLLDLEHNTKSFKPGGAGYEGNIVEFTFRSIDKIPKNAFVAFTSEYIWSMALNDKGIRQIDDGAFINLNCLHTLNLRNNSLSQLSEGMWQGLRVLAWLNLQKNAIRELRNLVFRELVGLKYLDLSRNLINSISVEAFDGLNSLAFLDLSKNFLRKIPSEAFSPLAKLEHLKLNSNYLQSVQPQEWKNLKKLTELEIADNSLTSFDPTYNFSFTSLTHLNLSMNLLTKFNVQALRLHLPAVTTIDLNGNPWHCEDVVAMIPHLRDSRIAYSKTKNTHIASIDGIPCIYHNVTYTEKTTTVTESSHTTVSSSVNHSTTIKPHLDQQIDVQNVTLQLHEENKKILLAIDSTRSLMVAVMVLVLVFASLELTLRTGLINRAIRWKEERYFNDDIALV